MHAPKATSAFVLALLYILFPATNMDNIKANVKGTVVQPKIGCTIRFNSNYEQSQAGLTKYLYETYGDRIYISIMNQYTPVLHQQKYPELNRKVTKREYEKILDYALSLGISNAFIQEGETAKESFIPVFDYEGVVADRQY